MAPRRPSTAGEIDSRMPFASAEVLLWGPEMKQQHAHLLTEMRKLQRHHEEYDARIRSTEHAAEAAQAAISRVRHLEQQLAAIEAEDDNKAFEKWAVGEMTRLGIFVDTNKHVRQKQIELDNVMSHATEDLDKLRHVPRDLQSVLLRLDVLEAGRTEDTRRIRSLEKEVTHLRAVQPDHNTNTAGSQTIPRPQKSITRALTPPPFLNVALSEATTEADEEDLAPMQKITCEQIQVPQSPEMRDRNPNTAFAPSITLDSPTKSARHRLMQRPSIHDSMLLQNPEEQKGFRDLPNKLEYSVPPATQLLPHIHQSRDPAPIPTCEVPSHVRVSPPPTQLLHHNHTSPAPAPVPASTRKTRPRARVAPPSTSVASKAVPRKRKLPEKEPQTHRLTRAQAKKNQAREAEEQKPPGAGSSTPLSSTQLVKPASSSRKKRKTAHVQESDQVKTKTSTATRATQRAATNSKQSAAAGPAKKTTMEHTQRITRGPARSSAQKAITSSVKKRNPSPVQPDALSLHERRSLIVILRSPHKAARPGHSESDDTKSATADRINMSPYKANSKPPATQTTSSRTKVAGGAGRASKRSSGTRTKAEISELDAS